MLLHGIGLGVGVSCAALSAVVVALGGANGVTGVIALVSASIGTLTASRAGFALTSRWHRADCRCPFCLDVTA